MVRSIRSIRRAEIMVSKFKLVEAAFQSRQVFCLEPAPAVVHAEDFVDRVSEQEAAVPDRNEWRARSA